MQRWIYLQHTRVLAAFFTGTLLQTKMSINDPVLVVSCQNAKNREIKARCFDTVFWDHTYLLKSALRQSSSCPINAKFTILVGFGLNLI